MNVKFKVNCPDLNFGIKQALLLYFSVLFAFSFQATAQPGGCESSNSEYCRDKRLTTLRKYKSEIIDIDEQIKREPNSSDLYYRRGKVFSTMVLEDYYGKGQIEFEGKIYFAEIDKKAVADYTKAISLARKAEYFEERGTIYRFYWNTDVSKFTVSGKDEYFSKDEILKNINSILLENENFKIAEKDFQQSIQLSANYETSKKARWKLMDIRHARGLKIAEHEYVAGLIGGEKAADVALGDLDYAINYHKTEAANNKPVQTIYRSDLEAYLQNQRESIYRALVEKGKAAKNFGKATVALETLKEAEKYWGKGNFDCQVFSLRASVYLKQNNFDSALRDLTSALESGNGNCYSLIEFRADVYFRRGDWQSAISDYTAFINSEYRTAYEKIYLKRGKAYLNVGEGEKAVADFDYVIEGLFHKGCRQYFLFRADAYKLAGKPGLAAADEKTVNEKPKNAYESGCGLDLLY